MINSEALSGLDKNQAINKAIELFEKLGSGKKQLIINLEIGSFKTEVLGLPNTSYIL